MIMGARGEKMRYSITESEQLILQQLWDKGSMTVMQLVEGLSESTHWSKHAIISFLKRMEEKQTVTYELRGRTKHYSAVPGESEVVVDSARSVLNRFFGGKIDKMVLYMAQARQLTDQDVDDLYALVEKLKEEGRKSI